MRVLLAGATGAIGRPLTARLIEAGHEVVGLTRSPDKADGLRAAGAEAVVCDVLEPDAARAAVLGARPEAVIDELTDLPVDYDPRRLEAAYARNDRVRREGTRALLAAAREADVRRYVVQSVSFLLAPTGPRVQDEDGAPFLDAPDAFGDSVRTLIHNEQAVTGVEELTGVALRYGYLYGPGTYYAPGGSIAELVRRRRFPVVGAGTGVFSHVHVDDAAAATVAAVESDAVGVFNVVDDDPAALAEWLPAYARALDAPRPLRAPRWLARLVAGPLVAGWATEQRGAANGRAKAALGWQPSWASWREGFHGGLG